MSGCAFYPAFRLQACTCARIKNRDARHQRVAGVSAAHKASRNGTSHTILSRHRPPQPVPGPLPVHHYVSPTGQNSRRPVSPDDTTRQLLRRSPCFRSTLEGVRAIKDEIKLVMTHYLGQPANELTPHSWISRVNHYHRGNEDND